LCLGFDTATEVGLSGIRHLGVATRSVDLVHPGFPALFTAGMSLVDTTDGILMLGLSLGLRSQQAYPEADGQALNLTVS
jgi:high-affinity nickel permease